MFLGFPMKKEEQPHEKGGTTCNTDEKKELKASNSLPILIIMSENIHVIISAYRNSSLITGVLTKIPKSFRVWRKPST